MVIRDYQRSYFLKDCYIRFLRPYITASNQKFFGTYFEEFLRGYFDFVLGSLEDSPVRTKVKFLIRVYFVGLFLLGGSA